MADELGQLEKEYAIAIAPLEGKLKRIKALKEALQLACPAKPEDEWTVEGERFGVKLGPRAKERTIDYKKLIARIKVAVFATFATCTLKDLEANVPAAVVEEVVSTAQTGRRSISTFEKGIAA